MYVVYTSCLRKGANIHNYTWARNISYTQSYLVRCSVERKRIKVCLSDIYLCKFPYNPSHVAGKISGNLICRSIINLTQCLYRDRTKRIKCHFCLLCSHHTEQSLTHVHIISGFRARILSPPQCDLSTRRSRVSGVSELDFARPIFYIMQMVSILIDFAIQITK